MVQITGKYELIKSENFAAYLVAIGLPEDKAKEVETIKPTYIIKHEGDKISVDIENLSTHHVEYILDKEIDEKLPHGTVKTTTTLKDDKLIMRSKGSNGKTGTRTYTFNGNEVTLVYKGDDPNCPSATRVLKKL